MKSLVWIILFLPPLFFGCKEREYDNKKYSESRVSPYSSVYITEIEGHLYMTLEGDLGGAYIIHAEHCTCKESK